MTPPPAKIKAFLGGLKEDYLEPAGLSYDHLFEGLVQAELVLRGILVQDQAKLWQQTISQRSSQRSQGGAPAEPWRRNR